MSLKNLGSSQPRLTQGSPQGKGLWGNPKVLRGEEERVGERQQESPQKIIFISFTVLPEPLSSYCHCPAPLPTRHTRNLSHTKPVLSPSRPGTDKHFICTQLSTGTSTKASCYLCDLPLSTPPPGGSCSNPSRRPPPGSGKAWPCWNIPVPECECVTQTA